MCQHAQGMAGSFNPRANVRDGIVQQWNGNGSRNGHARASSPGSPSYPNGRPCGMEIGAPATPPVTEEEEKLWRDQELNDKIMRQIEEYHITRPKGHKVSFHYNSHVEDMHFGKTHPMKPWRLTLTKHLVLSHGLQHAMDTFEAVSAGKDEVCKFHDPDYVDFLSQVSPKTFPELCKIDRYARAIPPKHEGEFPNLYTQCSIV